MSRFRCVQVAVLTLTFGFAFTPGLIETSRATLSAQEPSQFTSSSDDGDPSSRPEVAGIVPPEITGIAGIYAIGQPTLVFDHRVDKREANHLPDLPLTAWKESDGTVNLTVPHFENYRMRGPDLEHLTSDPNPIFSSTASASEIVEARYNYHHWLAAPYTFDGRTIFALGHTEWYACLLLGDCAVSTPPTPTSTGSYQLNSWANTVTSLVSIGSTGFQVNNYVSDTHSAGLNFEFTDGDPWLFYTYNPALGCGGSNLDRDIFRLKLGVQYHYK